MEDLIQYCRYYKGEEECPGSVKEKGLANVWYYEKLWVERDDLRDKKSYNNTEFIRYGMKDFNADDGVPITLKALLFNRFCHWLGGLGMESDKESFKEWYLKTYSSCD